MAGQNPVDLLNENNKRLRHLEKTLCCKLDAIAGGSGEPVTIDSSCDAPVFVQLCDPSGVDKELVFTTSVPICVDNGDSTFTTWLTRERIIWDSVTESVISRTPEFSQDGVNWVTTAPSSFVYGSCVKPDEIADCTISEAFGDDLSTLLPGNNFSITKPACCKIKVTTNIGTFHVVENIQHYSTSDFKCPVTITAVDIISGTCTKDKIHIISNKIS